MQKNDTLYLCAVILFAAVFSAVTLMNSTDIMAKRAAAGHAATSAGEVRDVDVERIEGLIREQLLSDHEASFYEPVDGAAHPVEPAGQTPSLEPVEGSPSEPLGGTPSDSRR